VRDGGIRALSPEQRREVAAWLEANSPSFPEPVQAYFAPHQKYLSAGGDPRKAFDAVWRELRRALGVTPSSEKRPSGSPRAGLPNDNAGAPTGRELLEGQHSRSERLKEWHGGLQTKHGDKAKRLAEKLAKMASEPSAEDQDDISENTPVEELELTEAQTAENKARAKVFVEHLSLGDGVADPVLASVNETLMPGGSVLSNEARVVLPASVPEDLSEAELVKTLTEQRVRYDFSVAVTRIELEVEKKVLVDAEGERHVISGSTAEYGPPRYSVTWSALATLVVLVGQFALPLHRLGTMLSTAGKRFTTGNLGRMLHYVAERFLPIYLQLAKELADCEILGGDDTSCRVVEVSTHLARPGGAPTAEKAKPPWYDYRTPKAAEESVRRCDETKKRRLQRRADGDREARRTRDETPSLGTLIGRELVFESPRRNGDGPKESMHTTVVSGRSVADKPTSLIVFYRSHLGSFGNLLESILKRRALKLKQLTLQGDLSSTNLVTSRELNEKFAIDLVGCSAHARRPFANYEDEDPVNCSHMLHLFAGLAMHEECLGAHGRNQKNVLAVRQGESRWMWNCILELATKMTEKWSPATKLGAGARYIISHFDRLTAYLDDPRLEPTNNLRDRMLRMEKLIEKSAMFRRSLEGRFVLDIIRTISQTAVAAGVPVHEYLVSVLRADRDEVTKHPQRFTPRAWAATRTSCTTPQT
jgi:hypothetical protein